GGRLGPVVDRRDPPRGPLASGRRPGGGADHGDDGRRRGHLSRVPGCAPQRPRPRDRQGAAARRDRRRRRARPHPCRPRGRRRLPHRRGRPLRRDGLGDLRTHRVLALLGSVAPLASARAAARGLNGVTSRKAPLAGADTPRTSDCPTFRRAASRLVGPHFRPLARGPGDVPEWAATGWSGGEEQRYVQEHRARRSRVRPGDRYGNAIRHGVTPRAYPSGGRTAPSAAEASAIQQLTESDARPRVRTAERGPALGGRGSRWRPRARGWTRTGPPRGGRLGSAARLTLSGS